MCIITIFYCLRFSLSFREWTFCSCLCFFPLYGWKALIHFIFTISLVWKKCLGKCGFPTEVCSSLRSCWHCHIWQWVISVVISDTRSGDLGEIDGWSSRDVCPFMIDLALLIYQSVTKAYFRRTIWNYYTPLKKCVMDS